MPYKVTPTGEIICDTAEEAIALAKAMGEAEGHTLRKSESVKEGETGSRWTESRFKEFMSLVKGDQKLFLNLLLDKPHGMTDKAIRQSLRMDSNLQLAGVTAGLAKNAMKVGILSSAEVFTKEVMHQGEERILEYKLADSFRAITEKAHSKGEQ